MYTCLSIREPIIWAPRGFKLERNGEKFNSILMIALYLAEEVKYESSAEQVCTEKWEERHYSFSPERLFITGLLL